MKTRLQTAVTTGHWLEAVPNEIIVVHVAGNRVQQYERCTAMFLVWSAILEQNLEECCLR